MKQVLEIEVPDGKKAVWKDGCVVFEDIDPIESIKTIEDAINFLRKKELCPDIRDAFRRLPKDLFEWKIAAYRAVVAAITYNEQRYLIIGEPWYPTIEFCRPGNLKNCRGNIIVGRIKSEGEEFDVVSGCSFSGIDAGLSCFDSLNGMSSAWAPVSCRSVGSKKAAMYISKQFGRLLFEISYGGINCNWEWID